MEREKVVTVTGPDESVLRCSSVYTERQDGNGNMPLHDILHQEDDIVKDRIRKFNSRLNLVRSLE